MSLAGGTGSKCWSRSHSVSLCERIVVEEAPRWSGGPGDGWWGRPFGVARKSVRLTSASAIGSFHLDRHMSYPKTLADDVLGDVSHVIVFGFRLEH